MNSYHRARLEDAAYAMDHRNRTHGWPREFDEKAMTITILVDEYLSREEASAKGLPTPEGILGEQPSYWKVGEPRGLQSVYPAWTVLTVLDWRNDDGTVEFLYEEVPVVVPVTFEVCDTCRGRGSHVNPSIDCMGISSDDFDEDPDFEESYSRGDYDVPCNACGGRRVYPQVDRSSADEAMVRLLDERAQAEYDDMMERTAEARMGC